MKTLKKIMLRYGIPLVSLALPFGASAFSLVGPGSVTAPNNTMTADDLRNSVCVAVNWLFWGLIVLAIIFSLFAAYRYLTASGNPEKVKEASNTLLYAVIAVVVALLAKGIPSLAQSLFGGTGITNQTFCS